MKPPVEHFKISIGSNTQPGNGELTVLFSGEGKPFPLHQIGPAVHNYYLVHTVLSGRGTFEIDGKRYECVKGDTFFIFPDVLFTYSAHDTDPWHYRWVAFRGFLAEPLLSSLGFSVAHPVVHKDDIRSVVHLYRKMQQTLKQTPFPELADLEANGLLRILLKEFGEVNAGRLTLNSLAILPDMERQIKQAVRFLSYQFAKEISIDDLSQSLGYHRTHLSKMFKQYTGVSPMQFLLRVRIERAKELLSGKILLTIDQVATSVGYRDALYFSKQFRRATGYSPSDFRSEYRNEHS
ncbi:AraC family transcriptional regulator [Paenibacillus baekrokdamisoli]|uniref:AraC family transcriptional regulator n=1 Tax=Paenibacillus baekrokdamisoli TaxID=1712516 RepID=A0A3G9J319_9BACL|nr:AraC family transcriptional regulator [Paenibacillus baekrokdamisoli]MBB3067712.1 AraC-like DNA-binding protein [Paenibacillus baekrokdamisoli]BBH19103.1 AraC family transcriptional regulator [Paenibacillus baekrokdamisoli]